MNWRAIGGIRGVLMIAALAAIGALIPYRFGLLFVDAAILLPYTAVAVLFTSSYAAQAFAGPEERESLERGDGSRDMSEILARVIAGAIYGWACWAVILGTSFAALSAAQGRFVLPPATVLAALLVFSAASAWFTGCLGSALGLTTYTVKGARDLLRLGIFFVLLLALTVPRLLPVAWQSSLRRAFTGDRLAATLALLSLALAFGGWAFLRKAARILADRRTGLSILG